MSDHEASEAGGEIPRRRGARVSKGARDRVDKADKEPRRPAGTTDRLQLHLSPRLVQRLAVHCGMKRCSWSAEAGRILEQYLAVHGQGREIFRDDPVMLEPPTE